MILTSDHARTSGRRVAGPVGVDPPDVPGAEDDVDATLLRLTRVALAATVRAGAAVTPVLSPTQIRALTILASAPAGSRVGELADGLAASASSATRIVQRLVRDGLVERAAGDGNSLSLTLSQRGVEILTDVNRQRLQELRPLLDDLPDRQRRQAVAGLAHLAREVPDRPTPW